jgi:hypothetical protein
MTSQVSAMPTPNSHSTKSSQWNLYWVESDGIEDCFVVARNSRSACRVEIEENGFDVGDVRATKIMRISQDVGATYRTKRNRKWPGYVYGKELFEKLGAQFRTVDGKQEMLLDDVVYAVEDDHAPCSISRERTIGKRAVLELRAEPEIANYEYHDEDKWDGPTNHLITALGICLATCQQIEHYIASSFLLGISKKQKRI